MEELDPQNRMISDLPDLTHLRETSQRPSVWDRYSDRLTAPFRSKTGITVMLALLIVAALLIGYWFTT